MRILIVDDDEDVRLILGEILTVDHYEVTSAGSARDALGKMETDIFDLIITDICMPGQNGIELAEYIKRQEQRPPVLAISGNPDNLTADPLDLAGYFADDTLQKPINPDELLATVKRLIANKGIEAVF